MIRCPRPCQARPKMNRARQRVRQDWIMQGMWHQSDFWSRGRFCFVLNPSPNFLLLSQPKIGSHWNEVVPLSWRHRQLHACLVAWYSMIFPTRGGLSCSRLALWYNQLIEQLGADGRLRDLLLWQRYSMSGRLGSRHAWLELREVPVVNRVAGLVVQVCRRNRPHHCLGE